MYRAKRGRLLALLGGLVALSVAASGSATAMEFVIRTADDGVPMLIARGPIIAGDAVRFQLALREIGRDGFGDKRVALASEGGLVGEAFAMADHMEQEKVSTLVSQGTTCSSACASILFVAGRHRSVLDRGRLGLHSCAVNTSRERSPLCNELIARRAERRGIPYAPMLALLQTSDPRSMKWLRPEEADCWGLTRWPPNAPRTPATTRDPSCPAKGLQTVGVAR
ncbi:hypothetical protein [Reyranella sp.]|uniref:hypothetical protein n=1 Tax=Reyranella sp. TaxID=1929291 RepID=UPI003784811C